MLTIIIILTLLSCICWIKKIYSIVAFSVTWIISILFVGFSDYYSLMDKTKLCLYTMIVSTVIGIVTSHLAYKKSNNRQIIHEQIINWRKIKNLLIICMFIFLYYFIITIKNAGGLNLNLIRTLNSANNSDSAFQGYGATLLFFIIAQPLLTAISILLIFSLFHKCKASRSIWILFMINAFLFLVTNAGRIFIIIILSFVLAGFLIKKRRHLTFKVNYKKVLIAFTSIFLILNLMTKSRNSSSSDTITFIQQAKEYIGCSILNMDYELKNLQHYPGINCGYYAYGGFLYYPIKIYSIVSGGNYKVPADELEYLQQIKVIEYNGRSIMYNALVPNAFYYYFDSGVLGIIFFSFISGFLIGKYEVKATSGNYLSFALYLIGFYYLIFSPMGSQLWKTFMPMTIIWSYILYKNYVWKIKCQ